MNDLTSAFKKIGLLDHPVLDGAINRCGTESSPKSKNGWYIGWTKYLNGKDYICCAMGDWTQSEEPLLVYKSWEDDSKLTSIDREALQKYQAEMQQQAAVEKLNKQQTAAHQANAEWQKLTDTGTSLYLEEKGVKPYGIRFGKDNSGNYIAIPVRNFDGEIKSLQRIYDVKPSWLDDRKFFLSGGEKKGCFHLIGYEKALAELPICFLEGYATGASIHQSTEFAVVVCFDAYNIELVVKAWREKMPSHPFVICADNDQWKEKNTGVEKATAVAKKYGCLVTIPDFSGLDTTSKPTDFNDLHQLAGLEHLKSFFSNVTQKLKSSSKAVERVDNTMYQQQFYQLIAQRLITKYDFKAKGEWLKGHCYHCGQKTLLTKSEKPTHLFCTNDDCEFTTEIGDYITDLFDDFSKNFPKSDDDSKVTANAFFALQKQIPAEKVSHLYVQEAFERGENGNKASATVRFYLDEEKTVFWEHLIDPVDVTENGLLTTRYDNFHGQFKDLWWCPKEQELKDCVFITNGILNAVAFIAHGYKAVALLGNSLPKTAINPFLGKNIRWVLALTNSHEWRKKTVKFQQFLKDEGENVSAIFMSQEVNDKEWHELIVDFKSLDRAKELREKVTTNSSAKADLPANEYKELTKIENFYPFHCKKINDQYPHYGRLVTAESYYDFAFSYWLFGTNIRSIKKSDRDENSRTVDFFCFSFKNATYSVDLNSLMFYKRVFEDVTAEDIGGLSLKTQVSIDDPKHKTTFENVVNIKRIATFSFEMRYFLRKDTKDAMGLYGVKLTVSNSHHIETPILHIKNFVDPNDFQKTCQQLESGANWSGSKFELNWLYEYWTVYQTPIRVELIDYIGRHEKTGAYIFDTCAIYNGKLIKANKDGIYKIGRYYIKTQWTLPNTGSPFRISTSFSTAWYPNFIKAYGAEGLVMLSWWTLSLIALQIEKGLTPTGKCYSQQGFFVLWGESGSGKTSLMKVLWKLFGQEVEKMSFNPSLVCVTAAAYRDYMASFVGFPVVWNETQSEEIPNNPIKTNAHWSIQLIKPLYDKETLGSKKPDGENNSKRVQSEFFQGSLALTQNVPLSKVDEANHSRVSQLAYNRDRSGYVIGGEGKNASDALKNMRTEELSGYLFKVLSNERTLIENFTKAFDDLTLPYFSGYLEDDRADDVAENSLPLKVKLSHDRIINNHALILAMTIALSNTLLPCIEETNQARKILTRMAIERQRTVDGDSQICRDFWEVFYENNGLLFHNHIGTKEKETHIAIHLRKLDQAIDLTGKLKVSYRMLEDEIKKSRHPKYEGVKKVRSTMSNAPETAFACMIFKL